MPSGATPLPTVPWGRRLLLVASVGYVGGLSIVLAGGRQPSAWVAAATGLGLAMRAAGLATGMGRATGWGLAVVVASLGGSGGASAGLDACAGLGVLASVAGGVAAIMRMPGDPGVVKPLPGSPFPGWVVVGVAWWAAIVARVVSTQRVAIWVGPPPALWTWTAVAVSACALAWSVLRTLRRRRLELVVIERARAIRTLLGTLASCALLVALVGRVVPEAAARLALAIAGRTAALAALHGDPNRVAVVGRRVAALAIVGGSVALVGAMLVEGHSGDPWVVTIATATLALVVGAAAGPFERPLLPEGGLWLAALAQASAEASRPDPQEAIRLALLALRVPVGLGFPSPELWLFTPSRQLGVDAAGYLHERSAELPQALRDLAAGEPYAIVRAEVLDALQVRQPELRPVATWMGAIGALAVALVKGDGESEGLLVLPRGGRSSWLTLEEVVAIRGLGDRLAMACRARATEIRMLERVQEAQSSERAMRDTQERLAHERSLGVGRDVLTAERLAVAAGVGGYAATSRMSLDALERKTQEGGAIAVVAPSGVDPIPFLARAHLSGARSRAPFVIVEGTSVREHEVSRWTDPAGSPLALAAGGMLVLADGAALPAELQQLIARACATSRVPWEPASGSLDLQLALTSFQRPDELVASGRLDPALAEQLGQACHAPVLLPRLRDRPEDLRALVTDRLAREGLRVHGRPIGIEPSAYARLAEHPFAGNDAELTAVVCRLVARCTGDAVRVTDLEALRLPPEGGAQAAPGRAAHAKSGSSVAPRKDPLSA